MIKFIQNRVFESLSFVFVYLVLSSGVLSSGTAHAANNVTAARVWPAQDYTRITLEANSPITYKMSAIKNPDRIVIDIDNIEFNAVVKSLADKILSSDPYIKQVRVGKFKPGVVRLVVDLKTEVKPNAFTLQPAGDYKHRLVLDIYPIKDPLMAMLAQHEIQSTAAVEGNQEGQSQPVTTSNDAVGNDTSQPALIVEPLPSQQTDVTETLTEVIKPIEITKPAITVEPKSGETNQETGKKNSFNNSDINRDLREITIAIDAGHGGEDPGARGARGSHEKHITLAIAKKLKERIDNEPGMRAVLTRDGDYFIPLHGRVIKARKLQADLFVSIHADAFTNPAARGSSVFALSERGATSASARYLAKKENESDLIGGVSLDDKDPVLARTLLDLSQTATINDSLKLGKAVLNQIGDINKLHKNHVEQAGFAVLKSPDIPSILVETAFISNPEEERKLNDDAYQDKLVSSILTGIKIYFATNPALAKTKVAVE